MTNQLLKETLTDCDCGDIEACDDCFAKSLAEFFALDDEAIEQCDLGDTTCEACN